MTTESNEQVTLHTNSWDRVVDIVRDYADGTGNATADAIANTIEAQRGNDTTVSQSAIAFAGLPGAGKTLLARELTALLNGGNESIAANISMGDAIRENYPGDSWSSESLADFAADTRRENAKVIPRWVTEMALKDGSPFVVIDGVRSPTDYEVLKNYFDNFVLIWVEAPFYTRLSRIRSRGREDEGGFDAHDLVKRDDHELNELGVGELINETDDWAEEFLPDNDHAFYDYGLTDIEITNSEGLSAASREQSLQQVLGSYTWLPEPEDDALKRQTA